MGKVHFVRHMNAEDIKRGVAVKYGCVRASLMTSVDGNSFWRACDKCYRCRRARHLSIWGRLVAECLQSRATYLLTLTVADDKLHLLNGGKGGVATNTYPKDIRRMKDALRDAGYNVNLFPVPEYGPKNGRGHWHCLLFVGWSPSELQRWKALECDGAWHSDLTLSEARFDGFVRTEVTTDRDRFILLKDDPDVLLVDPPSDFRSRRHANQAWRFWRFGYVNAQLVWSYGMPWGDAAWGLNYAIKYMSKDPWDDDKTFQTVPSVTVNSLDKSRRDGQLREAFRAQKMTVAAFERLPEHVKLTCLYGRMPRPEYGYGPNGSWLSYRSKRQFELEEMYPEGIPPDKELPYLGRISSKKGGWGADWFECQGVKLARRGTDQTLPVTYNIAGATRKKQSYNDNTQSFQVVDNGALRTVTPKRNLQGLNVFKASLEKQARMSFLTGFEAECERLEKPTAFNASKELGDDYQKKRALSRNRGPLGKRYFSSPQQQKKMQQTFADRPLHDCVATLGRHATEHAASVCDLDGWKRKRIQLKHLKERTVVRVYPVKQGDVLALAGGSLLFVSYLTNGTEHWSRMLETAGDLNNVCAGVLLPSGAKIAMGFRPRSMDETPIGDLKRRGVLSRLRRCSP